MAKKSKSARRIPTSSKPQNYDNMLMLLEPRIAFDAAGAAMLDALDVFDTPDDASPADAAAHLGLLEALAFADPSLTADETAPRTVVIVDPTVENYQQILESIDGAFEVIVLDGGLDGIEQIASVLSGMRNVEALHIISHGSSGELQLGSGTLNLQSMTGAYADELRAIGASLSADADMLVYGCDFASGNTGRMATQILSALTGADVAASDDLTGAAALGGDWELEEHAGAIEAQSLDAAEWDGVLAPLVISITGAPVLTGTTGTNAITGLPEGGVGYTALWANAGTVGGSAIDLRATVVALSASTVSFITQGDDASIVLNGGATVTIKWEIFAAGTSQTVVAVGSPNFRITDIDGVAGVAGSRETVTPQLNGLTGYTIDSPTNLVVTTSGAGVQVAGTQNQNNEPTSLTAFTWQNVSSWQVGYTLNPASGFANAVFRHDGDGDFLFVAPNSVSLLSLDLDGNNSTATGTAYQATYIENGAPIGIADFGDVVISQNAVLGGTLGSASVVLTNAQAGDVLSVGALPPGITASVDTSVAGQVTVTLTGADTIANYQLALQAIQFSNSSDAPSTADRLIDFSVTNTVFSTTSATARSTIHLTAVNDAPADDDETNIVTEDVTLTVANGAAGDLLNNASDVDGNPLTITGYTIFGVAGTQAVGAPVLIAGVGTITINANGSYSFAPVLNYTGAVPLITYTVSDGALTDTSTLSLSINPVNDAPADGDETNIVTEDVTLTVADGAAGDLLNNASDVDGDPLTITGYTIAGVAGTQAVGAAVIIAGVGTITINADGSYSFEPVLDHTGPIPLITYTVSDGTLANTSTLSLSMTPVNDAPEDGDETNTVTEDVTLTVLNGAPGDLLNNASDVDGNPLTITGYTIAGIAGTQAVGAPVLIAGVGTITINANGSYSFAPALNYTGAIPLITYTVSDGALTDTSTLQLSINPVNDAPVAVDDGPVAAAPGAAAVIAVLTNDSDADGDTLSVAQINGVSIAVGATATLATGTTVTRNADGTLSVVMAPGNSDTETFNYTISDGNGGTATATVTLARDTDGDGVANSADIDDDNDGILDTVEGHVIDLNSLTGEFDGTFGLLNGTQRNLQNPVSGYTYAPGVNAGFPAGVYAVTSGAYGNTTWHAFAVNFNGNTTGAADDAFLIVNGSTVPGVFYQQALAVPANATVNFGVDARNWAGNAFVLSGPPNLAIQVWDATGTVLLSQTQTGGIAQNTSWVTTSGTFNSGSNTNVIVRMVNLSTQSVGNDFAIDNFRFQILTPPVYENRDTDADGIFDHVDIDSDNDGITDNIEAQSTDGFIAPTGNGVIADLNGDGLDDVYGPAGLTPVNTDGTDLADWRDLNSDNDALTDNQENGLGVAMVSGLSTLANDADGDGLFDVYEAAIDGDANDGFVVNEGELPLPAGPTGYLPDDGDAIAGSIVPMTADLNYRDATPDNTAPVDGDETNAITEDVTLNVLDGAAGDLLNNATDAEGNPLTITGYTIAGIAGTQAVGAPVLIAGVGTITINANGSYSFAPVLNYTGAIPLITYTVSDGLLTDTSTLQLSITPVNDAPVDGDEINIVTEDVALVVADGAAGDLLNNASDVEGDPLTITDFSVFGEAGPFTVGAPYVITGIGAITINADGSYSFTPVLNYTGAIPLITYTVSDGALTNTSTLQLSITPVNDSPVAVDDGVVPVTEDIPVSGNVLPNDSDVDGDPLSVTQFAIAGDPTVYGAGSTAVIPGAGTLTIGADGAYTFTPDLNYNGPVPVATYTVSDGALSDTATLTLGPVTPVNDAPVAVDDGVVPVVEDIPVSGNVLPNDSDVDGDPLSVTQFTIAGDPAVYAAGDTAVIPGVGTLTVGPDGAYTFTPALNYNGPVPVATYTVSDGALTDLATLTLGPVTPVNDAPVAVDDGVVPVVEDIPVSGNVLPNDSDVDGDPLSVTQFAIAGDPTLYAAGDTAVIAGVGTLQINGDGAFTFTPALNYNGPVPSATYTISDGALTDTAVLTFANVTPVNDAPAANDDTAPVNEDAATFGNVLPNDTDIEGNPLVVTQFAIAGDPTVYSAGSIAIIPGVGTLLINSNGAFIFTPAPNYSGPVPAATYTISDGALTDTATLTLGPVVPANDPPSAVNDFAPVVEDTPVSGNVLANDTDIDGDALSVTQFSVPGAGIFSAGGTAVIPGVGALTIAANGAYTFTPAPNYFGPIPTAAYTITDGTSASAATLTFGPITNINDAPTAVDDGPVAVTEDIPATGNVLPNDSDVDGDPLSVTQFMIASDPAVYAAGDSAIIPGVGTLTIGSDGAYTFIPAPNYNGPVPAATYTLSDGALTDTATLALGPVAPVNDAPVANDDVVPVTEDVPVSGNVLSNDSDVDGDPLSVTQFMIAGDPAVYAAGDSAIIPGVGTLTIGSDGAYTFIPEPNYNGPVPVATYTVSDGTLTDTATLTLGPVAPVNDGPVANDDVVPVTEDIPVSGNVLPNDSDVDGDPLSVTQFVIAGDPAVYAAGDSAIIPGVGTLTIGSDGAYTFVPEPNYNGPVPVATYTVSDGTLTDTATLTLGPVLPVNDAPVANDDGPVAVTEDVPVSGNVLPNDSDVDGDALTVTQFVIAGDPAVYAAGDTAVIPGIGTLTIGSDGAYAFVPEPNYNGPVPVATYTLSDGALTDTATLTLGPVTPVNDAPVANDDGPVAVTEDIPVSGNVLPNDSDVDGDALTVTQFVIAGDPAVYAAGDIAVIPGVGTLTIGSDGAYTFIPAPNYNGPVPVATYTVSDGTLTDTAALTLGPVAPVNDAPVANDDGPVAVIEDTPATGNVLPNDSDVDGDALTVTQFVIAGDPAVYIAGSTAVIPGVGTLTIGSDGAYTFIPAPNYNGPVPVATYTVSDGTLTDTATLTLGPVSPVNDAPVANDDGPVAVTEDIPVSGNVLPNDSDVDGDALSVTQFVIAGDPAVYAAGDTATIPGVGTLTIGSDGSYSFVPEPNYTGPVPAATYTVSDGTLTDTAVLSFADVAPVNDAPVANDDGPVAVTEDIPVSGNVLPNDSDVDGDALSVTQFVIAGDPAIYNPGDVAVIPGVGTLTIGADGSYTFTPDLNYNGPVPVATYTVSDGALTDTATLTFGPVLPVNDAPVANDDGPVAVVEDTPATGNVLPNDSDVDGDALTVTQFVIAGDPAVYIAGSTAVIPGIGTLTIGADGSYTFTPDLNFNGPVPVATYTVSDGALTDTATLTFGPVLPVNDAPVANDDGPVAVTEDVPVSGNVLPNDSDVDGDALTVTQFVIAGDPAVYAAGDVAVIPGVGTLTIGSDGAYTFIPAPNYNGPIPSATYTISDGSLTDTAVLSFADVAPVNDAPVANDDGPVAVTEDVPVSGNVLPNDSDVDGDALSVTQFVIAGDPAVYAVGDTAVIPGVGTLTIGSDGAYTFIPEPNYNGPVPVATYTVSDGTLTDTAVLSFADVAPVNDAPVANVDGPIAVTEDVPVSGNVLPNDSDVDGDPLSVSQFMIAGDPAVYAGGDVAIVPGVGTLTIGSDGAYTFIPASNYNGPVPVATYTVSDGTLTDTATLTFGPIAPVNDAPVANVDGPVAVTEDVPVSGNVLPNDSDVDGDALSVTQFTLAGDPTVYAPGDTAVIPGIGTLTIGSDGAYTFIPEPNYTGPVPVATYTVSDGTLTNTATLALGPVAPVNDAPVANDDGPVAVTEDIPVSGNVLPYDSDVDGDPLTVTQFTIAGDPAVYAAGSTATIPGVGTLTIGPDGAYTFIPEPNYNGPVPVATYTVSDGSLTDIATLTFGLVAPVNDAPVANDDGPVAVTEDVPVSGNVLPNDSDVDGDPLSVTQFMIAGDPAVYAAGDSAIIPGVGTLTIGSDGACAFVPEPNYNGPVPVATYTVSDGALTDTATLALGPVLPVNDAPVANDDGPVAVTEDVPATGNVLPNDSDVDGDPLSVTQFMIAGDPAVYAAGDVAVIAGVGTLTIGSDGSYSFVPEPNYNGPVPVATYTVSDGTLTNTATLTLGPVAPVNDAPVANDDGPVAVTEDIPVSGNVLPYDSDVDGDALTVTQFVIAGDPAVYAAGDVATIPGVGTLTIGSDGAYSFIPAPNYNGPVPVATYTVSDGTLTDAAMLTFGLVAPVNDAPVANDDVVPVTEDVPVSGNVLSNDSDVDGDALTVTQFVIAGDPAVYIAGSTAVIPGIGTLTIGSDGAYSFVPAANYNGPVPVATYTVSDGTLTDTATLTFGPVLPVNDAPVANDDGPVAVTEDVPVSGNVLSNDSDVDGDPLSVTQFIIAGDPAVYIAGSTAVIPGIGTLTIGSDGAYGFVPEPNYNGPVPVATYTVSDGTLTDAAMLTFGLVAPVNDAPVANDDVVPVTEDVPVSGNVLSNNSDVDGDPLSVTQFMIAGDPAVYAAGDSAIIPGIGTLTIGSDGAYTFIAAPNYYGPVPVATYTVSDGTLTDTSTLTFGLVAPVNDAPVANDDVVPVTEDVPVSGNVLSNDSDVDGDALSVTQFVIAGDPAIYNPGDVAVIPGVGTLTIGADGSYTFTPDLNYNGPVPLAAYTVSDGAVTHMASLSLGPVASVNDENFQGSGISFETEKGGGGRLELDGIVGVTANQLTPLRGNSALDLANGAVASALGGMSGLHHLGWFGEDGVIAETSAGMDEWRISDAADGFDAPMFLGGSASLSFGGGDLMLDTVVDNGLVYIYAADLSGAPDGHGRTEFRVTMEDGRALPHWLKHAGNGVLIASQSADAGIVSLRIYALRGDGTVIEDVISVNIADGQLTRADVTHSIKAGGTFSDQLGRTHAGRSADAHLLMHALSPYGGH